MKTDYIALFLFLVGILMLIPLIKVIWDSYKRKKTYLHILDTLHTLYQDTNPYEILKNSEMSTNTEHVYGEIETVALLDLLAKINPKANELCYDLGSGSGKTLLAIKLCYPLLQVKGIEQSHALNHLAQEKYQQYLQHQGKVETDFQISYISQDFIHYPYWDADILFINATALQATWPQILGKLLQLKPGARVIITSKTLPDEFFNQLYQGMEKMSWGLTSTYIYEKKK